MTLSHHFCFVNYATRYSIPTKRCKNKVLAGFVVVYWILVNIAIIVKSPVHLQLDTEPAQTFDSTARISAKF